MVLAKLFQLPVVLSTVNAKTSAPTIHQLQDVLGEIEAFDRTTINAWEDVEFVKTVKATGRKKLIMTAPWTEACLSFPALNPCVKVTKYIRSWTRSAAHRSKPIKLHWDASLRLVESW
jgi:nicotinamidase-related amidase